MILDVNNFGPFHAETWGTFSDVSILIMTIIGTIFLILNFLSQKKINKKQSLINELLTEKERREIRPYFMIDDFRLGFGGFVNIELKNARALHLRINPAFGGKYKVTTSKLIKLYTEPGFKITLQFKENSEEENITRETKIAVIFCQDELKNSCYQQEVWIDKDGPYITPPIRVKQYDLVPIKGAKKIKSTDE